MVAIVFAQTCRDIDILKKLRHPNIVEVLGTLKVYNYHVLKMEPPRHADAVSARGGRHNR
jgi:DNA repair photolyase